MPDDRGPADRGPHDRGRVHEISWLEIFPFLILPRTVRIAAQPRLLLLAAAALLLTGGGWFLLGEAFSGADEPELQSQIRRFEIWPWRRAVDDPALMNLQPAPAAGEGVGGFVSRPWRLVDQSPIAGAWSVLSRPAREMFSPRVTMTSLAFLLLCLTWGALVWSLFGAAVCRVAAVQLAAEERIGLTSVWRHVRSKWLSYLTAPMGALLVLLAGLSLIALFGLVMRAEWGVAAAGVVWPLLLVLCMLAVLVLAGLFFGWPLMWATLGVEESDHFEAISRSFSYVFGRPLHLLFYAVVACALGTLGWLLAAAFAEGVLYITAWAACWGGGAERFDQILAVMHHPLPIAGWTQPVGDVEPIGRAGQFGLMLIRFWSGVANLLVLGFVYSFFWTSAVGVYLLMRFHVDGTELDAVELDDDAEPHALPPLERDEQNVPTVTDDDDPAADGEQPSTDDGGA